MKTENIKPMFKTWPLLILPTELHFYFTLKYFLLCKEKTEKCILQEYFFVLIFYEMEVI